MSYTQQVTILSSSETVFEAITKNVQKWWGNTDFPVCKVGDEFTTSFDKTFWKFRIVSLIPNFKIVWECIDARHIHAGYEGIEKEWIGTAVQWTINSISEDKSVLSFNPKIVNGL